MKPNDGLLCGIILIALGVTLYASSGFVVTVYTITSDSYWTYYEFQHSTHYEYQCRGLGVAPFCAFIYFFAYGGAAALSFAGAVMTAVSLHRLIERPQTSPRPAAALGSCPKCGTMNPPTSKYRSECATKLAS